MTDPISAIGGDKISYSSEFSQTTVQAFNRFQEMMAAEKELEEKTLQDLLDEVEEELYEEKITDFTSVFNSNKLKEQED